MTRYQELLEEFRSVVSGRVPLLDVIFPPLLFTVLHGPLALNLALVISLLSSLALVGYRLVKQESFGYATGGLAAILLAAGLAWITQSAAGYYLPGILTSGLTTLLCLISLTAKKPFAAWSSHLTRNWPLAWYWHERIRPAYAEVTLGWTVFFGAQFAIQGYYYLQGSTGSLGWIQILTGWPALVLILAASYLYGLRRLDDLHGPSVEEFETGSPPPWDGQRRGF